MCNSWCLEFAKLTLPYIDSKVDILEVGSRNVNGTIRDVLSIHAKRYIGIDICEGVGVDQILDVSELNKCFDLESFDFVVSTEMLEHCQNWQEALFQMASVLKIGGILLITTRSPGFELHDYPADFWRFSVSDFKSIFSSIGEVLAIESDMTLGWPCGVGIIVRRISTFDVLNRWHENLKNFKVYSMLEDELIARHNGDKG